MNPKESQVGVIYNVGTYKGLEYIGAGRKMFDDSKLLFFKDVNDGTLYAIDKDGFYSESTEVEFVHPEWINCIECVKPFASGKVLCFPYKCKLGCEFKEVHKKIIGGLNEKEKHS